MPDKRDTHQAKSHRGSHPKSSPSGGPANAGRRYDLPEPADIVPTPTDAATGAVGPIKKNKRR